MGNVLDRSSYVTCPHTTGIAKPDQADTRVTVSGQALMTIALQYTIGGCPQNTPCSKGVWIKGATHVTASGRSVAIDDGQSLVVPAGNLKPVIVQRRVQAT